MKKRLILASTIVTCVMFAGDLAAHDTWLLPQSMRVPVGRAVSLAFTSGMAFPADDFAIKRERVARSTVRFAGSVRQLTRPRSGAKALTYSWTPATPGIAAFAIELAPKTLTLTPDKIEEYFAEINASKALRATWDSMPMPRQWRESYTKHASTFIRVGDPASDTSWRAPLGMSFEIVPVTDPTMVRTGNRFAVRVLRSGEGVANLQVGLQHEGEAHVSFATTNATGLATMTIPRAGRWLVNVTDLRRTRKRGLEWESDFATLTLGVLP